MSINTLLSIDKFILAVYYTKAKCFQYSIIDEHGTVSNVDGYFLYFRSSRKVRSKIQLKLLLVKVKKNV